MTSTNRNFSGLARKVREVAIGMSTKAKIVVGCAGVFVASATLFVVYDSLSEKTRMRRGILREIEKTMENKKKESVAIQKESWNQWKEEKKAENRRKREAMNETETIGS